MLSYSDLESLVINPFDLEKTLNCGQVFHWQKVNEGWVGAIDTLPFFLKAQKVEDNLSNLKVTLFYSKEAGTEVRKVVSHYLALDHNLSEIYSTFPSDPTMQIASSACAGIRIIRQPLWECMATFITSAMKQVAHIRQISMYLRTHFGTCIGMLGSKEIYSYPTPQAIARQTEETLRAAGLGWRAKNLLLTARQIDEGKVNLESLKKLDDEALHQVLCQLPGIGPKVANCILLFAYERLSAVPIDVWIKRVLKETYFKDNPAPTDKELKHFARQYFGPYAGYAQQYLFHYARTKSKKNE